MINIKNCFIAAICVMLTVSAFGGCLCEDAIRGKKTANGLDSVVSSLNGLFGVKEEIKDINKIKKEDLIKQSTTDKKINAYLENFYKWYGGNAFKEIATNENTSENPAETKPTGTLFDKYGQTILQKEYNQVDTEVNKALEEYIKNTLKQTPDEYIKGTQELYKQALDYTQSKKDATYPDMLNPLLLFNRMTTKQDEGDKTAKNNKDKDKYSTQANNFIKSLNNSLFPIKTFYFPPEPERDEGKTIMIQVPLIDNKDPKNPLAYTTIPITKGSESIKEKYKNIKEKLSKNPLYQEYMLKNLTTLSIRDSLINNLFYTLKVRERKGEQDSLSEKERKMAMEGLNPVYYNLNKQGISELTTAELNLKNLHTSNKMVYFLYQISKQMEYANFMQTVRALQDQSLLSATDEQKYIQPIKDFILQELATAAKNNNQAAG